jgi:hypothetical protein
MTLPTRAKVIAATNFAENLSTIRKFMEQQDPDSVTRRMNELRKEIRTVREILAWSPSAGRAPRFLQARSAQGLLRLQHVHQVADQLGLRLAEMIVPGHVILYGHTDDKVILLAIKSDRQIEYR